MLTSARPAPCPAPAPFPATYLLLRQRAARASRLRVVPLALRADPVLAAPGDTGTHAADTFMGCQRATGSPPRASTPRSGRQPPDLGRRGVIPDSPPPRKAVGFRHQSALDHRRSPTPARPRTSYPADPLSENPKNSEFSNTCDPGPRVRDCGHVAACALSATLFGLGSRISSDYR